jgi:hypothetical protein
MTSIRITYLPCSSLYPSSLPFFCPFEPQPPFSGRALCFGLGPLFDLSTPHMHYRKPHHAQPVILASSINGQFQWNSSMSYVSYEIKNI